MGQEITDLADLERIKGIYDRQAGRVYRTAMVYMRNSEDAEDIVQSVFMTLIEKGIVFSDFEHEKAWMITAARNRCIDMLKSAWRSRTDMGDEALMAAEEQGESPGADEAEQLSSLLMQLPEEQREILLLHYYEGYTVDEVAAMTGRKESGIRSAIASAKRTLRKIRDGRK